MRALRSRGQPARAPARVRSHATSKRRFPERSLLRFVTAALIALFAPVAASQVSGTVSVVSDYRYRGVSFSDDKPAAQLGLTYDDASGLYAGLFASTIRFASPPSRGAQTIFFAGYAQRTASGLTFEAGADCGIFFLGTTYRYPEVYVGMASDNVSARLYYASRYYLGDADTIYAELNGTLPLSDRVRLIAHAGALRNRSDNAYAPADLVFDGRAGIAFDVDRVNVQLAWVGLSSNGAYPIAGTTRRHTAVLSLSIAF
jgi:uncharacterized protein (TIGR02001 family)